MLELTRICAGAAGRSKSTTLVTIHTLVLNLEALLSDLVAIHLLDGHLSRRNGIVAYESETLRLASVLVDVHLSGYNVSKGRKCRR